MPLKPSIYVIAALLVSALPAWGQPGQGPSKVQTGLATQGTLAPHAEFRGTVYFKEVSDVASEVRGKVTQVLFEEGQTVNAGDTLVVLDDTLLQKEAAGVRATRDQYKTELRDAEVRFDRSDSLLGDGIVTPEQVDDLRFRVESLRHQLASVEARLDRLATLIDKKVIVSPFDGIVIARNTELGEWMSEGGGVATVARRDSYEIIASVPEDYLEYIEPGAATRIDVAGRTIEGRIVSILPRGDIATRSFPVKVRVEPETPLLEGMSALVNLPTGPKVSCVLIPRDAILQLTSGKAVFSVSGEQAVRHMVRVLGYRGDLAGIEAPGIRDGDRVVVRGQERLRDGSPIEIVNRPAAPANTE